jgi:predicted amidohydrolase YtcJ
VSPEHPAYLVHVSGHLAVANTVALRLANVTRETRNPQGGVIEHGRDGEPTGILKDTAMGLVARLLPSDPPDLARRAVKLVSERAAEVGLTTLHDVAISPEEMRGYQEADARGWLKVRVRLVPLVANVGDAERLTAQGLRTGFGSERLKLGGVKMFADGGMGARSRSYLEAGIVVGAGSDVPVTPISPWWGIWSGVVRKELQTGEVLAPEERLSVREVLRLYTRNGAWLGFEEGRLGRLAPGAFADMIVVDRDVLAVPAEELKDVKVLQTIIAGEVVFEAR